MSTVTYIGVDPGQSGGIAFLRDGEPARAVTMPATETDLWRLIVSAYEPAVCVVEKVGATPQMGVVSAFKFGQSVGLIRMACIAAGFRLEYVTPQKWQRHFGLIVKGRGLGQRDADKKNRNKAVAQQLFPELAITHALADALLIAEYGRHQHNGLSGGTAAGGDYAPASAVQRRCG